MTKVPTHVPVLESSLRPKRYGQSLGDGAFKFVGAGMAERQISINPRFSRVPDAPSWSDGTACLGVTASGCFISVRRWPSHPKLVFSIRRQVGQRPGAELMHF